MRNCSRIVRGEKQGDQSNRPEDSKTYSSLFTFVKAINKRKLELRPRVQKERSLGD